MKNAGWVKPSKSAPTVPANQRLYRERELGAIAARWDARAPGWDSALQSPECHLNEDDAYAQFLREVAGVVQKRRTFCQSQGVVDLGCGTGLVLADVISRFRWGIGVDISPEMIRAARRKRIPHAKFIIGDCFEIARLCPPAGAILSRGVLLSHYGREHAKALLQAGLSALVDGGFLICDLLNKLAQDSSEHKATGKFLFSAEEAEDLAREAGFKKVKLLSRGPQRVLILLLQR
jgi:trans-aconitate methyltransferase